MSGSSESVTRAVATILKHDPDHFRKIGALGGAKSKRHLTQEEAAAMGKIGGTRSKRGPNKPKLNSNNVVDNIYKVN